MRFLIVFFGAMICLMDGTVSGMEGNYGFEDRVYEYIREANPTR